MKHLTSTPALLVLGLVFVWVAAFLHDQQLQNAAYATTTFFWTIVAFDFLFTAHKENFK